jgi:hypothetical protein
MAQLQKDFLFAVSTGYKGDYDNYVKQRWSSYCHICIRCDDTPMSYTKWLKSQGV